jgi:PIN like domain
MKILLDENVPRPLHDVLRHLLKGHEVDHVGEVWPGKKDILLLRDAGTRYNMFVTNDTRQYFDPDECRAIRESRLHHVTYALPLAGLDGIALACGAICAGLRAAVLELDGVREQRIVRITTLDKARKRYAISDPRVDPPSAYWT